MKKVLVTGGAGFIGSHIVDALIDNGYFVAVLDDLSTGSEDNVNPAIRGKEGQWFKGDIREKAADVIEQVKPEYIIHNAAQISVKRSMDDPINDAEQNIIGALALLEQCKNHNTTIKRVIFPSSSSIYGAADSFPTKEDAPIRPQYPYAIAKATIEQYLKYYQSHWGIDYIVFRYSNVFGPRQNPAGEAGAVSVFIDQMMKGQPPCIWGNGLQSRDFIHVSDVAAANLAGLRYEGNEHVFNIATGENTSINTVCGILQSYFQCYSTSHRDFEEKVQKICLDASHAKAELGWAPQKVEIYKNLIETAQWFQEKAKPK